MIEFYLEVGDIDFKAEETSEFGGNTACPK
jgi:hypothetical protein